MAEKPQPSPSNRKHDCIRRFREAYEPALAEAEVSATHTATEGWTKLYHGFYHEEQERRQGLARSLKALTIQLEEVGLSEDGEKELSEIKKSSAMIRDRRDAFELQTVGPVKRAVIECDRVIEEAKHAARREESEAPLVNVGLEELMRMEVQIVRRPKWDGEIGRVSVTDPDSAS